MKIGKLILLVCLAAEPVLAQGVTIWAENFEPYGYAEDVEIVGLSTEIKIQQKYLQ